MQRHRNELRSLKAQHYRQMSEMEAYINSLSSRVNHLSVDNRRLSAAGSKLSQQLEENNSQEDQSIQAKIAESRKLQNELANLDQHLIHKYEAYILQQKSFNRLSLECDDGKSKDKKCLEYVKAKEDVETMASQIKFLNTKREILLSQISRAEAF